MNRCRVILVSVALLALAAAALAAQQRASASKVEAGWDALQRRDGATAATIFYEALLAEPRNPALHFGAGLAAHLLGRETDAIASLTRALTLNPKLIQASELLGIIQYAQGDLNDAIATYDRALAGLAGQEAMRQRLEERSEEHTSELQSLRHLVCRLLLE